MSNNESEARVTDPFVEINRGSIRVLTPRGPKTFNLPGIYAIDDEDLTTEFTNQAALYGYFTSVLAYAEQHLADLDLKKDQAYARLDEAYRAELDLSNKKYTEPVIKALVQRDVDYEKAYRAYHDMQYDVNVLKGIVKALDQRAYMLISLGSQLRHEASMTGMAINDQLSEKVKNAIQNHHQK